MVRLFLYAAACSVALSCNLVSAQNLPDVPLAEAPSTPQEEPAPADGEEEAPTGDVGDLLRDGSAATSSFGESGGGGDPFTPEPDALARQEVSERLSVDGVNLLGDQIDMNTGSLVFSHTDVSLPGNSGLEVAIRRRLDQTHKYTYKFQGDFGDWQLDIPQIWTKTAQGKSPTGAGAFLGKGFATNSTTPGWPEFRCTSPTPGPVFWGDQITEGNAVSADQYSDGLFLSIPGAGSKQLHHIKDVPGWPADAYKGTTDGWAVKCIDNIPGGKGTGQDYSGRGGAAHSGEGFIAIAPNGDQYRFDRLIYRDAPAVNNSKIDRYYAFMFATEVKDVNGNWVRYTYNDDGYLTRIDANDGRRIDLYYEGDTVTSGGVCVDPYGSGNTTCTSGYTANSKRINRVVANGRTWHYDYYQNSLFFWLDTVTLPDNRQWEFGLRTFHFDASDGPDPCRQTDTQQVIVHPNGMRGYFKLSERRHSRTYVPSGTVSSQHTCTPGGPGNTHFFPGATFETMSVIEKKLVGPGYPEAVWTYQYPSDQGALNNSGGLPDNKQTIEINPLGQKTVYHYNRRWSALDGQLMKQELFPSVSASTPIQTTEMSYTIGEKIGTTYLTTANQDTLLRPTHARETKITRGNDSYTTRYTYNTNRASSSFSYGNPTRVEQWSNTSGGFNNRRITDTTYEHNKSKWVIGLPKRVTRNGKIFDEYTYDSLGRRTRSKRFGVTVGQYTYHTGGNQKGALRTYKDALNRTATYNSYKRGTPQSITRPDGETIARTVDNNGWVTSDTNARGYRTSYTYTPMGRIASINRPHPWADSTFYYEPSPVGGAFRQRHVRGSLDITTNYDGLQRPFLVKTAALSGGGVSSFVETRYDALGRATYVSFPRTSYNNAANNGTETTYDALGRPTRIRENVSPFATTTMQYIGGDEVRTTDPEGDRTTVFSNGYGSPDDGNVTEIRQPENVTTTMTYDIYGNMLSATQGGNSNGFNVSNTHRYYYDSRLRLCRHSVPETGDTLFRYDNADQLTETARGQSTGTSCPGSLPSSARIVNSYDTLGRLTRTNFPGSTPDIDINYDENGNVTRNSRGGVVWDYTYLSNDQLHVEKLTIDGRSYRTEYAPTPEGFVRQYRLPSGRVIVLDPNGLGQATKASSGSTNYASNITYHVNGALDRLTYGNGFVRDTRLNARQLIDQIKDTKGSTRALYYDYAFDKNGRITRIYDEARAIATTAPMPMTISAGWRARRANGALARIHMTPSAISEKSASARARWRCCMIAKTASTGSGTQPKAATPGRVSPMITGAMCATTAQRPSEACGSPMTPPNSRSPSPMRRRARSPMTVT